MRKAGDVLKEIFIERFGIDPGEKRESPSLLSSWEKICSEAWSVSEGGDIPAAATHSRIYSLERGQLHVEADHPGWMQILQTKQAELLHAIRRSYPEQNVKSISFRLSR